jgi:hypothetical protein
MSGGRVAVKVVFLLAIVAFIGRYAPHTATISATGDPPAVVAPAAPAVIRAQAQAVFGAGYGCAANIITRESGWNPHATNPGPGHAYGLPQALPGDKMAAAGPDWRDNPATQLSWMKTYVDTRYGGACPAWTWWQAHHWY